MNPGLLLNTQAGARNGIQFIVPKYTIKLREKSFMIRGPKLYNSLPKELKEFPNINAENPNLAVSAFKKKLDSYLNTIPDEPNISNEYGKRIQGYNFSGMKTNSIIRLKQKQGCMPRMS